MRRTRNDFGTVPSSRTSTRADAANAERPPGACDGSRERHTPPAARSRTESKMRTGKRLVRSIPQARETLAPIAGPTTHT
jgi:hypothetical protein